MVTGWMVTNISVRLQAKTDRRWLWSAPAERSGDGALHFFVQRVRTASGSDRNNSVSRIARSLPLAVLTPLRPTIQSAVAAAMPPQRGCPAGDPSLCRRTPKLARILSLLKLRRANQQ